MEEQRVETGLFPIHLDAHGRIRSGGTAAQDSEQLDRAVDLALGRVRELAASAGTKAEMRQFIAMVHGAADAMTATLPEDLFAPVAAPRAQSREVLLPTGDAGEVLTTFTADTDPRTHLMRRATREVVTRLSGTSRQTVETWTLAPQPA
jgi:hypothetical protein